MDYFKIPARRPTDGQAPGLAEAHQLQAVHEESVSRLQQMLSQSQSPPVVVLGGDGAPTQETVSGVTALLERVVKDCLESDYPDFTTLDTMRHYRKQLQECGVQTQGDVKCPIVKELNKAIRRSEVGISFRKCAMSGDLYGMRRLLTKDGDKATMEPNDIRLLARYVFKEARHWRDPCLSSFKEVLPKEMGNVARKYLKGVDANLQLTTKDFATLARRLSWVSEVITPKHDIGPALESFRLFQRGMLPDPSLGPVASHRSLIEGWKSLFFVLDNLCDSKEGREQVNDLIVGLEGAPPKTDAKGMGVPREYFDGLVEFFNKGHISADTLGFALSHQTPSLLDDGASYLLRFLEPESGPRPKFHGYADVVAAAKEVQKQREALRLPLEPGQKAQLHALLAELGSTASMTVRYLPDDPLGLASKLHFVHGKRHYDMPITVDVLDPTIATLRIGNNGLKAYDVLDNLERMRAVIATAVEAPRKAP